MSTESVWRSLHIITYRIHSHDPFISKAEQARACIAKDVIMSWIPTFFQPSCGMMTSTAWSLNCQTPLPCCEAIDPLSTSSGKVSNWTSGRPWISMDLDPSLKTSHNALTLSASTSYHFRGKSVECRPEVMSEKEHVLRWFKMNM